MDIDDDKRMALPLSPAPSSLGSGSASVLPSRTRARPLVSSSAKESDLIRYLDELKLHVERFHAKRRSLGQNSPVSEIGYATFDEAAADMTRIFNLAWMSSTREYSSSIGAVADCKQPGCRCRTAYRSPR
jgi:hypothetical protein